MNSNYEVKAKDIKQKQAISLNFTLKVDRKSDNYGSNLMEKINLQQIVYVVISRFSIFH